MSIRQAQKTFKLSEHHKRLARAKNDDSTQWLDPSLHPRRMKALRAKRASNLA